MDSQQRFESLLQRYHLQQLSLEERAELMTLIDQGHYQQQVLDFIERQLSDMPLEHSYPSVPEAIDQQVLAGLRGYVQAGETSSGKAFRIRSIVRYVAAAVVVVAFFSWWYLQNPAKDTGENKLATTAPAIAPAVSGATLQLADGTIVQLDSIQTGLIAEQEGSRLQLMKGQLSYESDGASAKTVLNTLSTARGRLFLLQLPDGSKAWLNAASSITYPVSFSAKERNVSITGEVYFEVAQMPESPFRVTVNQQTIVEVLGTSFNINAYADEPLISTTLISGAVKVKVQQQQKMLQPGQQLQSRGDAIVQLITNTDLRKVLAWKEGIFNFRNAGIEEVMRQISRWYDVDVVYEKGIPAIRFEGMIGRDLNLSDLLAGLKETGLRFRIEGKKLIVLP